MSTSLQSCYSFISHHLNRICPSGMVPRPHVSGNSCSPCSLHSQGTPESQSLDSVTIIRRVTIIREKVSLLTTHPSGLHTPHTHSHGAQNSTDDSQAKHTGSGISRAAFQHQLCPHVILRLLLVHPKLGVTLCTGLRGSCEVKCLAHITEVPQ
jgi:hypothetical protein